jgi:hypothetical protein
MMKLKNINLKKETEVKKTRNPLKPKLGLK